MSEVGGVRSQWNGDPPTGKSVSVSCSCRACVRSCVCVIERESRANSSREFRGGGGCGGVSNPCWVGARCCPVRLGVCCVLPVTGARCVW